jgi:hypothetical protein
MKNIIIDGVEYTPVIKQSQIVDKHYHFELYPDSLGKMTWDKAVKAVKKLGNGWRLPTIEECFMIYKDKLIDGDYYWTSLEHDNYSAWAFSFDFGSTDYFNKKIDDAYVHVVRDLINKQD